MMMEILQTVLVILIFFKYLDCSFKCSTCSNPTGTCIDCKGDRGTGTNAVAAPSCTCADGKYDDGTSTNCVSNTNYYLQI